MDHKWEADQRAYKDTKDSLKVTIMKIMAKMNKDHLLMTCKQFLHNIQVIINTEGSFIEQMYNVTS